MKKVLLSIAVLIMLIIIIGYGKDSNNKIDENSQTTKCDIQEKETIKSKVTVEQFGAKGDGIADDTKAIQNALDCGNVEIEFKENAIYKVVSIEIREGNEIKGNNATIKRPNLKSVEYNFSDEEIKWSRLMKYEYESKDGGKSNKVIINNLNFDGSCWEMWNTEEEYKYEQASLLLVNAFSENNSQIEANIEINNCTFKNNYSDGIHIVSNSFAKINDCKSKDCFRGGLVITGGCSEVECNNMECRSEKTDDGIDIEIDSLGYDNTKASKIYINNLIIDNDFDVGLTKGAEVIIQNVTMTKDTGNFYLENIGGKMKIQNAKLYSDGKQCYFEESDTVLENIDFYCASDIKDNTKILYISDLGKKEQKNSLKINNCRFYGKEYNEENYKIIGIGGGIFYGEVDVTNCYFDSKINEYAIGGYDGNTALQVEKINVENCVFDNFGYLFMITKTKYIPKCEWNIVNVKKQNEKNKGIDRTYGKDAIVNYYNCTSI